MFNADMLGNKNYKTLIKERLIDGSKSFFDTIIKLSLNTGLRKEKTVNKALSIVKEDKQAFGTLLSNNTDLNIAFQYPLTSYPLSLSDNKGDLRQGNKSNFRNFLISESDFLIKATPLKARWIYDSMAIIRTLKPKSTYNEILNSFYSIVKPKGFEELSVEIINDTYLEDSIKNQTRLNRGIKSTRTHVSSLDQKILPASQWNSFFNNIENKADLVNLIAQYFKKSDITHKLTVPVLVNDTNQPWKIKNSTVNQAFISNQEEADIRIVLHCTFEDAINVVVSTDTDVLVLLAYMFSKTKPANILRTSVIVMKTRATTVTVRIGCRSFNRESV